jgi:hypothetical protein
MAAAKQFDSVVPLGTGHDWWVVFEGHPKYRDPTTRPYQPLYTLETHDLIRCDPTAMVWWARSLPGGPHGTPHQPRTTRPGTLAQASRSARSGSLAAASLHDRE